MPVAGPGYIAIVGSGELSDSMAEVHRQLMARLPAPPRPVFVDSLAGFELNVEQIDRKAAAYFLRNFGLDLGLARYRSPQDSAAAITEAVLAIQRANYLLAGPGSPSYGIRLWRDSVVWNALQARWTEGAGLVFASVAAIVLGRFAIPVYEIYKAGHDVCLIDGLDLLGRLGRPGLQTFVVPHWNNRSGERHDTRFCFMGAPRFAELEAQLPSGTLIIGVDEYTTLLIDSQSGEGEVLGAGTVTLRRDGRQVTYDKGQRLSLGDHWGKGAVAVPIAPADAPTPTPEEGPNAIEAEILGLRGATQAALDAGDLPAVAAGLVSLGLVAGAGLEQGILNRAELAVQSLQAMLPQLANSRTDAQPAAAEASAPAALLDLLITIRSQLRAAGQWALADRIRDGLAGLGYTLQDTPEGTIWHASQTAG